MSDYLLQSEKKSLDSKLKVTNSSLNYINQPQVDDSDIALAVAIPYPVLMKWHGLVGTKDDEGNTLDYITLLNSWILGHCFKINKIHGLRILGRLRREAGVVVNKYTGKKVSGSKKEEAKSKHLTLHIRESELVIPEEVERTLSVAEEEIKEWKQKCKDLEREKEDLCNEMKKILKERENEMEDDKNESKQTLNELEEKNKELHQYINNLEKKSWFLCQGKKFDSLGKKQQMRRLNQLKEKADIALWFLASHGRSNFSIPRHCS